MDDAPPPMPGRAGDSGAAVNLAPTPPRAFAQGVGVVLQGLGVIMALTNCCICSLGGLWDPNLTSHEARQVMADQPEVITDPGSYLRDPVRAAGAATLLLATIGGLGLAAFGLGMQADRPRPAYAALATNLLLAAVFLAAGVALWTADAGWWLRSWHALLTLLALLALPFTIGATVQVVRHPPPPVDETLPPGFDVRDVLAGEKPSRRKVAQLRAKLEIEQRELDRLERELRGDGGVKANEADP
jgi:hypothetical protein